MDSRLISGGRKVVNGSLAGGSKSGSVLRRRAPRACAPLGAFSLHHSAYSCSRAYAPVPVVAQTRLHPVWIAPALCVASADDAGHAMAEQLPDSFEVKVGHGETRYTATVPIAMTMYGWPCR
jgi:hypothetical protein